MQELSLIVDNRERNLEVLDGLMQNKVKLSFMQLPVGDYIVSDRMCIERKTVRDFESSIMDSRLFDQASRMCAAFPKPILLIEGNLDECTLGRNVIIGATMALFVDHNIQVINSANPADTSYLLAKLAEKEQFQERREPRMVGNKRLYTQYQWQLALLGMLPGIGPTLAKSLINHFKTIRNICNADIDGLMEIPKIGSRKAETIYNVINSEFEAAGK